MAHHRFRLLRPVLGASLALAATAACPQDVSRLPAVTVTGKQPPAEADVAGFGAAPLERLPLTARIVGEEQIKDRGTQRLSDITRSDAAVSDAYNAEGYWDQLTVRGFVLDQRYNYRREGLPINAETSIALDNKARIEVLEGTSGIQAGTSAPGGLVNFVVKRPDDVERRSALLAYRGSASVLGAVDWSSRLGAAKEFGLRVNLAAEHLDPELRSAKGERHLLAAAGDWRLSNDTLLEAEIETSHRSQPSQPGFSMLGTRVPDARDIDPRINLNNQAWSQPVVLDGMTGTLRWKQRLSNAWRMTATLGTQHLKSDDRVAFPFGCTAEDNFDRYCSDGSFDFYDYRSDDERRRTDAADLAFAGRVETARLVHDLTFGALASRYRTEFAPLVFNRALDAQGNEAGIGTIDGLTVAFPNPGVLSPNTNLKERSTELYVRDAIRLSQRWSAWLGLRHTRIARSSTDTDGNLLSDFTQSFTTPWAALSFEFAPQHIAYASWGQGIESAVTPRLPAYGAAAGTPLRALKSRQWEIGVKGRGEAAQWSIDYFDIDRPATTDLALDPNDPNSAHIFFIDGSARHRGLEANVGTDLGAAWRLDASMMLLDAKRRGASDATLDGLHPTNVPERSLKLAARYRVAAVPGLELLGALAHEGERFVLPDNSARIPAWTRIDAGLRFEHAFGRVATIWRAGIDNLFDRRAWRESPFEFDHVYLYPLAPRTAWLSVQVDL
jgi:iron complex outermembrane receptor protein